MSDERKPIYANVGTAKNDAEVMGFRFEVIGKPFTKVLMHHSGVLRESGMLASLSDDSRRELEQMAIDREADGIVLCHSEISKREGLVAGEHSILFYKLERLY